MLINKIFAINKNTVINNGGIQCPGTQLEEHVSLET